MFFADIGCAVVRWLFGRRKRFAKKRGREARTSPRIRHCRWIRSVPVYGVSNLVADTAFETIYRCTGQDNKLLCVQGKGETKQRGDQPTPTAPASQPTPGNLCTSPALSRLQTARDVDNSSHAATSSASTVTSHACRVTTAEFRFNQSVSFFFCLLLLFFFSPTSPFVLNSLPSGLRYVCLSYLEPFRTRAPQPCSLDWTFLMPSGSGPPLHNAEERQEGRGEGGIKA